MISNNIGKYYNIPLKTLVFSERNKNLESIRENYGQLGVDIFQKEKKPTILTPKDNKKINKIINKIKQFFGGIGKEDYKETDSLNNVMFKYINNKKYGTDADIEHVFGKNGSKLFKVYKSMGYVE